MESIYGSDFCIGYHGPYVSKSMIKTVFKFENMRKFDQLNWLEADECSECEHETDDTDDTTGVCYQRQTEAVRLRYLHNTYTALVVSSR